MALVDSIAVLKSAISGDLLHVMASASALGGDIAAIGRVPVQILAGAAAYLLDFSPEDSSIHRFAEKMDNWSLWGGFMDDARLKNQVQAQLVPGAKVLISLGVHTNMMTDPNFWKSQTGSLEFEMTQQRIPKNDPETLERVRALYNQTDFISAYTGNIVTDVVLMGGEHAGFSPVTRKLEEYFNGDYELTIGHSAGKWALLNARSDVNPSQTMIWGGPDTFSENRHFYSVQHNGIDPIPFLGTVNSDQGNASPDKTGSRNPSFVGVGVSLPIFGLGNVEQYRDTDPNPINDHGWQRYFLKSLDEIENKIGN